MNANGLVSPPRDTSPEDRWNDDGGQHERYKATFVIPTLTYPLYLIANDQGVLVAKSNGEDCILLFHRKEFAERHIAESKTTGIFSHLLPMAVPSADAFRQGLESLPTGVTCALWDVTVAPGAFIHLAMDDLLQILSDESDGASRAISSE